MDKFWMGIAAAQSAATQPNHGDMAFSLSWRASVSRSW